MLSVYFYFIFFTFISFLLLSSLFCNLFFRYEELMFYLLLVFQGGGNPLFWLQFVWQEIYICLRTHIRLIINHKGLSIPFSTLMLLDHFLIEQGMMTL